MKGKCSKPIGADADLLAQSAELDRLRTFAAVLLAAREASDGEVDDLLVEAIESLRQGRDMPPVTTCLYCRSVRVDGKLVHGDGMAWSPAPATGHPCTHCGPQRGEMNEEV